MENCGSADAISLIPPRRAWKHWWFSWHWKDKKKGPTAAKSCSFLILLQIILVRAKMAQRLDSGTKVQPFGTYVFCCPLSINAIPLRCRMLWAGLSGLTNEQIFLGWQLQQSYPPALQPPVFGVMRVIQYPGWVALVKASWDSSPCLCADYLCHH